MYLTQTSPHAGIADGLDYKKPSKFPINKLQGLRHEFPICVIYLLPSLLVATEVET